MADTLVKLSGIGGGCQGALSLRAAEGFWARAKAIVDSVESVGAWQPDMPAKNKK